MCDRRFFCAGTGPETALAEALRGQTLFVAVTLYFCPRARGKAAGGAPEAELQGNARAGGFAGNHRGARTGAASDHGAARRSGALHEQSGAGAPEAHRESRLTQTCTRS